MTLDTNILIAFLAGDVRVIEAVVSWRRKGTTLFLSAITKCELLSYPLLTASEEQKIDQMLHRDFVVLPFDDYRAERTAIIRRATPSLKIPDAAIASVALEMGTPLVTRNVRDFKKVIDLHIITL